MTNSPSKTHTYRHPIKYLSFFNPSEEFRKISNTKPVAKCKNTHLMLVNPYNKKTRKKQTLKYFFFFCIFSRLMEAGALGRHGFNAILKTLINELIQTEITANVDKGNVMTLRPKMEVWSAREGR